MHHSHDLNLIDRPLSSRRHDIANQTRQNGPPGQLERSRSSFACDTSVPGAGSSIGRTVPSFMLDTLLAAAYPSLTASLDFRGPVRGQRGSLISSPKAPSTSAIRADQHSGPHSRDSSRERLRMLFPFDHSSGLPLRRLHSRAGGHVEHMFVPHFKTKQHIQQRRIRWLPNQQDHRN
jgi:hypothetical protein